MSNLLKSLEAAPALVPVLVQPLVMLAVVPSKVTDIVTLQHPINLSPCDKDFN
jgi:hypothetical protein